MIPSCSLRSLGPKGGRSAPSEQPRVTEMKLACFSAYQGNEQSLPAKPCVACGRTMSWRKRWTRSWKEVKFCSDSCRKAHGSGVGA